MSNRIQIRRGTTADWETTNIVLSSGELGFDFERNILKIGTGFTPWNNLEPFGAGATVTVGPEAPAEPEIGNLWFDSVSGSLFVYLDDSTTEAWIETTGNNGVANITIRETAPANPNPGELWWNSTTGILYIYYVDETSGQWVDATYGTALDLAAVFNRLDIIEGDESTSGSIAKAEVDANSYADAQIDTAIAAIGGDGLTFDSEAGVYNLDLSLVSQDIIPDVDVLRDLGSSSKRWKDLYLSGNTIFLGNIQLKDAEQGKFVVLSGDGQTTLETVLLAGQVTDTELSGASTDIKARFVTHRDATDNPHAVDATQVGLGDVTNESKETMFTDAALTGVPTAPTAAAQTDTTQIATTAFLQGELSSLALGDTNIIEEIQAEGTPLDITAKAVNVTRAALGAGTGNADVFDFTTTILAVDEWSDETGFYTLEKTINGILDTDNPIADLDLENALVTNISDIQDAWAEIYQIVTTTNTVTFYALEEPVFPEDTVVSFQVVR